MSPMTTTGYAGLAGGEEWRYVGDTDEPAFENGWDNFTGTSKVCFRIREVGIVDIYGHAVLASGTPGTTIFTLPEGYRPARAMSSPTTGATTIGGNTAAVDLMIDDTGAVYANRIPAHPVEVRIAVQIFLDAPELA